MQVTNNSANAAPGAAVGSALSSDFNTFLRMLTVQMQNQDPLKPMEATDFAVQLATFSGVEQQVLSNQLLQGIAGQFAQLGIMQLAGWVGQEARAAADVVWFEGEPVTLAPNPAVGADRIVLNVHDSGGQLVAREDLPAGAEPWTWGGADAAGDPLPVGRYILTQQSYSGETLLAEAPVEYYSRVSEIRSTSAGPVLVLAGGVEVAASAVTGLRARPHDG